MIARCRDCVFEGTPEQIRAHRAAPNNGHPAAVASPAATWRERYRYMQERRLVPTDLYLPSEVAELFRVDPKTVTQWARKGKLPCVRTLGGHRRYRAADIEALFDQEGI